LPNFFSESEFLIAIKNSDSEKKHGEIPSIDASRQIYGKK